MREQHDILTVIADLAATAILAGLGWSTASPWWWILATLWAALTIQQIKLTRRAARYRRSAALPPDEQRSWS